MARPFSAGNPEMSDGDYVCQGGCNLQIGRMTKSTKNPRRQQNKYRNFVQVMEDFDGRD